MHKLLIHLLIIMFIPLAYGEVRDPSSASFLKPKKTKVYRPKKISYQLQSIFISNNTRIAVINGKTLYEGDALRGGSVEQILSDRVIIRSASRKKTLRLFPQFISKEPR